MAVDEDGLCSYMLARTLPLSFSKRSRGAPVRATQTSQFLPHSGYITIPVSSDSLLHQTTLYPPWTSASLLTESWFASPHCTIIGLRETVGQRRSVRVRSHHLSDWKEVGTSLRISRLFLHILGWIRACERAGKCEHRPTLKSP